MFRALEIVGNLMDEAVNAHSQLPNEYTKGQLEGIRKIYTALVREIDNPSTRVSSAEEVIPFSTPPLNKRGNTQSPELQELKEISSILSMIHSVLNKEESSHNDLDHDTNEEETENNLFNTFKNRIEDGTYIMDDENRFFTHNGYSLQQEIEKLQFGEIMELLKLARSKVQNLTQDDRKSMTNRPWDKSFGERMRGNTTTTTDTFDPDTGETGKQTVVGAKFNPDDERTVEEWNQVVQGRVPWDEMQDLKPGE
jgi:anti-sigma28 factor (negative regulator of flagellin synthesis)